MVVTGSLQVADEFEFDGVVIVLGDVQMNDHVKVTGALIQGPSSNQTQLTSAGSSDVVEIRYSSEVISTVSNLVSSSGATYTKFTGWQEISRS